MDAVKLVNKDEGLIEGWGIPFGGPLNGRDLDGEAFTKDTKFYLDAYEKRPLLYNHGLDDLLGFTPIGVQTKATRKEKGIWVEAQIDKASEYADYVMELLGKEMLGFSSGANPRSIAKNANGLITEWFYNEQSLTPIPANPFAMVSVKSNQPVISIKAQADIFAKLGRLPDVDEAQELAAPYMKQTQQPPGDVERRVAALEEAQQRREKMALLGQLNLEHERIVHGGVW